MGALCLNIKIFDYVENDLRGGTLLCRRVVYIILPNGTLGIVANIIREDYGDVPLA